MSNYPAWINNSPYYTFDVWGTYWDNGNSWGYSNDIGNIYSGEIFYFIQEIVHPGGGDTMYKVLFQNSGGSWVIGYMNEYDCQNSMPTAYPANLSSLEDRLALLHGQYEYVNGKKLVWAKTNRTVSVYDSSGNFLFYIPADRKVAKDVTNTGTFKCGATHRDWLTFTHWYDPAIGWRFLVDGGPVCFIDCNIGEGSYAINVW